MTRIALTFTATSVAALIAAGAVAQTDSGNAADANLEAAETSLENAGSSLENAAEATGNAAESAAEATADAVEATAERAERELAEATATEGAAGIGMSGIDMANVIRSRDLTGAELYSTVEAESSWDSGSGYMTMNDDYSDVGEVEDLLFDSEGQMVGIVAEVGGFLDIGDKHVIIGMDEFRIGREEDDFFVVINMTEEQLEARESVDEGMWN